MNTTRAPSWTKSGKCVSAYEWETAPSPFFDSGKQAAHISLMRKRPRNKGAPKELFVCKWYRTSGVQDTSISGSKFIHREWEILSSIHHPNIVAYEDFSYDPNGAQMAKLYLEYCPGGDLSRHTAGASRDNRLSCHESLQVLEQLAQALLYIHHGIHRVGEDVRLASAERQSATQGTQSDWLTILHRDIKPANVFIFKHDDHGIVVKLGDFGIAKFETEGTDTYVGSRDFLAPEQRTANQDGRRTTTKSDIYALGVSLKMVTRVEPDSDSVLSKELLAGVESHKLQSLLDRMTEEDQHRRPEVGAIIETIREDLHTPRASSSMLEDVIRIILDWNTSIPTNSGKKKTRRELSDRLRLCRRLILASGNKNDSRVSVELLGRTIDFMNSSIEALDLSGSEESLYPSWKASIVDRLIRLLRQYGIMDFLEGPIGYLRMGYNLGEHDYQSLESVEMPRRKRMLWESIKARFDLQWVDSPKRADSHMLEAFTFARLLSCASSDAPTASRALQQTLGVIEWAGYKSTWQQPQHRIHTLDVNTLPQVQYHDRNVSPNAYYRLQSPDLFGLGQLTPNDNDETNTVRQTALHEQWSQNHGSFGQSDLGRTPYQYTSPATMWTTQTSSHTGSNTGSDALPVASSSAIGASSRRKQEFNHVTQSTTNDWVPAYDNRSTFVRPVRTSAIRITDERGNPVSFRKPPTSSTTQQPQGPVIVSTPGAATP